MIRQATLEDAPFITEMGMRFVEAAGKPEARFEEMEAFVRGVIPMGGAFVSGAGMIVGVLAPLYYRPDYLEAHEVAWWAEDSSGLRLLRAFEDWAEAQGAREIVMSTLPDFTRDAAGRLLQRRGYAFREAGFRKVI